MERDRRSLRRQGRVSLNGLCEGIGCRLLDTGIRTVNAFRSGHIVLVGKIPGKIGSLKIDRLGKIERFDRLHQLVRHFLRTVYRDMVESNRSAAHHQIVIRLGVIVLRIAPRVGSCRLIVICASASESNSQNGT